MTSEKVLAEEVEDIAAELATLAAGGVWSSNCFSPPWNAYVHREKYAELTGHLRAGRLREAFGIVADGAFRAGVRHGPAMMASGQAKVDAKTQRIKFMPQRVPPEIGVLFAHAMSAAVPRAEFARLLKKGGRIRIGNMDRSIDMPALSGRDVDEVLREYPHRSRAGRPRKTT